MTMVWSIKTDAILAVGKSLEDLGIRNWALEQDQALEALNQLAREGIAVLGGDVYLMQEGKLQVSYDNWYCERPLTEKEEDFVSRSIEVARTYIKNYRSPLDGPAFFAIVPQS
jgi:hypothetical protein